MKMRRFVTGPDFFFLLGVYCVHFSVREMLQAVAVKGLVSIVVLVVSEHADRVIVYRYPRPSLIPTSLPRPSLIPSSLPHSPVLPSFPRPSSFPYLPHSPVPPPSLPHDVSVASKDHKSSNFAMLKGRKKKSADVLLTLGGITSFGSQGCDGAEYLENERSKFPVGNNYIQSQQ